VVIWQKEDIQAEAEGDLVAAKGVEMVLVVALEIQEGNQGSK
jgi:hypothetical protein